MLKNVQANTGQRRGNSGWKNSGAQRLFSTVRILHIPLRTAIIEYPREETYQSE